jgi:5-hydroxyisourate hydrolase-like protein (transthyretin family)
LAGDAIRQLRSVQLNLVERTNDNVTSTRQIQRGAYQMVAFRASDYTYKSKEMGGKRDFYLIEPVGVPFREYLTVNRQALNEENEFAINVVFNREPQTSSFRPQTPAVFPGSGPAVMRRQAY